MQKVIANAFDTNLSEEREKDKTHSRKILFTCMDETTHVGINLSVSGSQNLAAKIRIFAVTKDSE